MPPACVEERRCDGSEASGKFALMRSIWDLLTVLKFSDAAKQIDSMIKTEKGREVPGIIELELVLCAREKRMEQTNNLSKVVNSGECCKS